MKEAIAKAWLFSYVKNMGGLRRGKPSAPKPPPSTNYPDVGVEYVRNPIEKYAYISISFTHLTPLLE